MNYGPVNVCDATDDTHNEKRVSLCVQNSFDIADRTCSIQDARHIWSKKLQSYFADF